MDLAKSPERTKGVIVKRVIANLDGSQTLHLKEMKASEQLSYLCHWILCRGGCSGRGVQWIGVVLHSKAAYNTM